MIKDIIARRYAKALFSIIEKDKETEAIRSELYAVSHAIETNREMRNFVFNPIFGKEEKERVLIGLLQKTGARDITKKFIKLLLKKDRIKYLKEIVESLSALIVEKQNKKKALVVTASKLPDASFSKIKSRLSDITKKDVELEEKIDDSIIGGVMIQVGSLVYNGSIKTQLENVKNRLLLKR
ncbi:MAG: ATP synthase F1 subunit delta [Nitrospirae bacterium]|nr:ATP synthase F1 subunit delta [Nitrospirota bacterium]